MLVQLVPISLLEPNIDLEKTNSFQHSSNAWVTRECQCSCVGFSFLWLNNEKTIPSRGSARQYRCWDFNSFHHFQKLAIISKANNIFFFNISKKAKFFPQVRRNWICEGNGGWKGKGKRVGSHYINTISSIYLPSSYSNIWFMDF